MQHRARVVIAAIVTVAAIPLIGHFVGTAFIPEDDRGDFELNIKTPQGYTLARTDAVVRDIERQVGALLPQKILHQPNLAKQMVADSARVSTSGFVNVHQRARRIVRDDAGMTADNERAPRRQMLSADHLRTEVALGSRAHPPEPAFGG